MNYFNYFSEIEETFNRRRGKYQFLSPLDWALIESWQQQGVPLHVVLGGIERVFDNANGQPQRKRSVKSLMYCREEIEAQYEEWRERQIGKNEETSAAPETDSAFSDVSIREHLVHVAAGLDNAARKSSGGLQETLIRVSARLSEIEKTYADAESLENALSDLERLIDEALLENADARETEKLRKEVEKQTAQYRGAMNAEVFDRTFKLMLLKKLRERTEIPNLSLFYL